MSKMGNLHEGSDSQSVEVLRRDLAQSRKASNALQQMVDALASLPAVQEFVPAALRIIASTFETTDCSYFEHRRGELIHLRYWFRDGEVFGSEAIRGFGSDHKYSGVKSLETGFHVPDSYLGMPFRKRTKALVLNHGWDQFENQWEELRKPLGWYMVLNVPLIIDGDAQGGLVMNRGRGTVYTETEIELAERLGQQLALAIEVDRLAAAAREAASARERELSAQARIEEMAKADEALQQTTDALAAMPDLANFIPEALQIVANAFDANNCAYYEHRRGDLIRLRYWFFNNRVLGPKEIAEIEDEELQLMRQNGEGFIVPDSYLGVPFRHRTKATIVDHSKNYPRDVRDEFCIAQGMGLELNVPLVVSGEADGALVISRNLNSPYTSREVALAERLGQQLALAMEVSRLSAEAKEAAVARERERSARERSAELASYGGVLKQTIDSLVEEEDFLGFIGRLLVIASDRLQAPITEYWRTIGMDRTALLLTCRDGIVYNGSDDAGDRRTQGITISPGLERVQGRAHHRAIDMLENLAFRKHVDGFGMQIDEWCHERGVRNLILVPLMRNESECGALCVYLPPDRLLDQAKLDLAFTLGQQVSLAVRMIELAEESKQSALLREREIAANNRAAELTNANDLLRSTLEQLSDERDLQTFPRAILRIAMEQSGARDGVIFVLENETKTLRPTEYLGNPDSPQASTIEFARPFPIDSAPVWASAMAARAPVVYDVELDGHMLLPGAAEWHRRRGNRSVVVVPMFVNMEPYGYFGMGLEQPAEKVSKIELGLTLALTQQASLAIQLTRLAEESKQAAVAHEREKDAEERAAEFANANEVLRSTLDQLSKEDDLHSFPRTILKEAMKHADARDGLILLYDAETDTLRQPEYINAGGIPASEEFSKPFPASGTPAWNALVSKRLPIVFDVEQDAAMLLPGLAEWHRRRGNRSIIAAAMFIGSQPYGYFGITLGERASEVSKVKQGLIHALTQQATLAIQLTRLAEASQQATLMVERQQLVVQERANLAREIHDKLAQGYAAIMMQQHAMRDTLLSAGVEINGMEPALRHVDTIERLCRENLAEARRTMDELRADPFGSGDLAPAIEQCVRQLSREHEFPVSLEVEENLPPLRRYVETELCRIVLEALTNSRKHARTGSARVVVHGRGRELCISIQDDGIGFDMQKIGASFGISSMRERAARAGAAIEIVSTVGHGTEVQITLTA